MNVERDDRGDVVLESAEVASRFGLTIAELRRLLRLGLIRSSIETGEGEHEGMNRLRLRCGNRIWTAILDVHGHVTGEELHIARSPILPS